jgi:hypothetical protein
MKRKYGIGGKRVEGCADCARALRALSAERDSARERRRVGYVIQFAYADSPKCWQNLPGTSLVGFTLYSSMRKAACDLSQARRMHRRGLVRLMPVCQEPPVRLR